MNDSGSQPTDDRSTWARLSDRQRACLDLLLDHKTSKQIARELGISKDTVDQRITAARQILGAGDRSEAAIRYRRLKALYHRVAYDPVEVAEPPRLVSSDFTDGGSSAVGLHDSLAPADEPRGESLPFGIIWRPDHGLRNIVLIGAGLLFAALILIVLGLVIAQSLTQLLSG